MKKKKWEAESKVIQNQRNAIHQKLLTEVFDDKFEIRGGIFKGMKYIHEAKCSALLPKFTGSYEEPIQNWVADAVGNYKTILNIGCAEGYYAVGFALLDSSVSISAYDVDQEALKLARQLAELNGVTDRITFSGLCTHQELQNACKNEGVLVFCDIEGGELELLDPAFAPNLANADMLVEAHDCFIPGITESLISRFQKTHKIDIVVDHPRLNDYSKIDGKKLDADTVSKLTDEYRPDGMRFLMLRSLKWMK